MSIVFSSTNGIIVSEKADKSYEWSGLYNGIAIKTAVPIEHGERCVLLLDPDASPKNVFENLFCIDPSGRSIWIAHLPSVPDRFLDLAVTSEGMWGTTWSGFRILLDKNSGRELKRVFVK
jgi:hypothetical protein